MISTEIDAMPLSDDADSLNSEKLSKAEIPNLVPRLVEVLDKYGIKPNSEVFRNTFEDPSAVLFCAYPNLVRQYFDLADVEPRLLCVSINELEDGSPHSGRTIIITITCSDESTITIDTSESANASSVKIDNSSLDIQDKTYALDNFLIGQMLISLSLRPNDMEDISHSHLNGTGLDPMDPRIFGLLRTALQDRASMTEVTRKHVFTVRDDKTSAASISLQSGVYADNSDWYDISLHQSYQEDEAKKSLKMHAKNTYLGNDPALGRDHNLEGRSRSHSEDCFSKPIDPLIVGLYMEAALAQAIEHPHTVSPVHLQQNSFNTPNPSA